MKIKRWKKDKEFSTKTLTQVEADEIVAESRDYAEGLAPVSRDTQFAESLEDMDKLQRSQHQASEMKDTHNYGVLQAVRDYDPEAGSYSIQRQKLNKLEYVEPKAPIDRKEASVDRQEPPRSVAPEAPIYAPDMLERVDPRPVTQDELESLDYDLGPNYDNASIYDEDSYDEAYTGEDSDFYTQLGDENEFSLQRLSPEDENYEDIMEKFVSAPSKPKYWFKEQGDHWICSCGMLNKGDSCVNCGLERDLLRNLFILREPGDEPSREIVYTEFDMNGGKKSTNSKLIIAIVAIAILLIGTGALAYLFVIKPSMDEEAAANQKAAVESLQTNVVACGSSMNDFMRASYISAGDTALEDDRFETAIKFYGLAQNIKDSDAIKDKINKAKFEYLLENKDSGGEKFEKYLFELMDIGYSGVKDIYDEYFAWNFSVVTNTAENDDSTDLSTASRKDIIYFHVFASGGAPDETIDVYYEVQWPNGKKETDMLGKDWKAGSKVAVGFKSPIAIFMKEGSLSFKVFDSSTQELLASDSIKLNK